MNLTITKVTPTYPKGVYVQWDLVPDTGVSGDFVFELWRSGSSEGPWTVVGPSIINGVQAFDDLQGPEGLNLLSLHRTIYYYVSVTDPRGSKASSEVHNLDGDRVKDSKEVYDEGSKIGKRKFLLRRKIIREIQLSFKVLNGVKIAVLKRRHYGLRCRVCYDPLTKLVTKSKCTACYGTGWTGGYYPPIISYAKISPSPNKSALGNDGRTEPNDTQMALMNYPVVEEGDVLVELDSNHRWVIKQVSPTELQRLPVHQRVVALELPRTAPEFKIAVGDFE